ncbi:DUF6130 family protein [Sphingomonas sp.]|uniref:DUF6130 family protein n=1 Tax=Sphingomonas sp. TaxID=28214 RepID=UPI0025CB7D8F|nr:DUF6130 family protein [Sphingomonas sp.]
MSTPALAQTAEEVLGPAAVLPLAGQQPAPRLFADPPRPEALARGLVVIQYRAENLRIVPVYGPNALDVTPRIGHVHVTLDDAPWHWVDASGEPIILQYLPAGPHTLLIELVDANHKPFDRAVISFVVPPRPPAH